jgi:hypothetical protein
MELAVFDNGISRSMLPIIIPSGPSSKLLPDQDDAAVRNVDVATLYPSASTITGPTRRPHKYWMTPLYWN